jgi:DNA-binding transcriptional MerR regulator
MSLTVGQLAKLSGLSDRSLHHYDEIGLLCPSERSNAGYRLYSDSDVERLNRIQARRWLNLPLSEVKGVLDRGGSAVPDIVDRKIAALTQQIDEATDLRTRLLTLRSQVLQGKVPADDRFLSAVELYQRYEKHFSADDLGRFKTLSEEDTKAWRRAYDDVLSALQRKVSPDSDEAQELAYRWGIIMYKLSGGELTLAWKAKAAYESDAGVRSSMSAITATNPEVMTFLLAASHHGHLKILARHLAPEDMSKLKFSTALSTAWMRVVSALKAEQANHSSPDGASVQALASQWSERLADFTSKDAQLKGKLLEALHNDPDLQKRWLVNEDLIRFAQQALQSKTAAQ